MRHRTPLIVAAAFLGLGLAAALQAWTGLGGCAFRELTGRPCPTCGGSRAALALLTGHPLAALAWNPLAVLAPPVLLLLAACRRRLDGVPRRVWILGGVAAVLANWLYLLVRG